MTVNILYQNHQITARVLCAEIRQKQNYKLGQRIKMMETELFRQLFLDSA